MSARSPAALTTVRLAMTLVWSAGRGYVLLVAAASVVVSVSLAGQLLVGRELLNLITGDEAVDPVDIVPYLVALGVMLLLSALSQAAATELRVPLSEQVHRKVTEQIFDIATEAEIEVYEGPEFHDRLARAQAGGGGHSSAIVWGTVTMLTTVFVALGVTAVLLTIAPVLVPIVVLGYLPVAFVTMRNNRAFHRMEWNLSEIQRERGYLQFLLTHRDEAKEIRSYGIAATLRRWHGEHWDERLRQLRALIRRRLALITVATVLTTMVMVGTLGLALALAVQGTITIGDAAVAIVGLQQLSGRLRATSAAFAGIHQGVTFLRDFEKFRAMLPEIRERKPTGVPPADPSTIVVDRLSYQYPGSDTEALRDVSFEIQKGQILAIVGANGSGKSTLAKLLCGLLTPSRGIIQWDSVDINQCDPELVRRAVAPVYQDYARYLLHVRTVIGLGDVERLDDLEDIMSAASAARADDIVESLPAGLDTRLGKAFSGGTDLSIGQWQRLAIARAFFRDAPIVVLDEPSASLDPQAEADLFDSLQRLGRDRIVMFISHRFATVRSADVVIVLDQGRLVEMGTHDELMLSEGLYSDLFRLQADRFGRTS